jgi:hypothetical protein
MPKAWYRRTNKKGFIKQLAQIERRRARIRHIKKANCLKHRKASNEQVQAAQCAESHHFIGKSRNFPQHVGMFVTKYSGDPALKVRQIFTSDKAS